MAQEDFDAEDSAVLAQLMADDAKDGQQAATSTSTSEQAAGGATASADTNAPAATTTTDTAAAPAAATPTAAPAPEAASDHGDVRGALRASRRAERQARSEAERLKAENEELRAKVPQVNDGVTDAELAELDTDMPIVAKAVREVRAAKAAAPAPAPAVPAQAEFVPPTQPAQVQDVIDDIPALLAMQNNPDQSAFKLAVKTDEFLQSHPKWADKPLAERLAECARRVQVELGTSAPPPQPPAPAPAPVAQTTTQRRDPAQAIASAPAPKPNTLSDIHGGAASTTESPGVAQFMNMSDDEIMAALARG